MTAHSDELLCRDQARKEHATELRKAKEAATKASKARSDLGEPKLSPRWHDSQAVLNKEAIKLCQTIQALHRPQAVPGGVAVSSPNGMAQC